MLNPGTALDDLANQARWGDDSLSWVTHRARTVLPRVDGVSISVLNGWPLATVGATDPLVAMADALQYRFDEGPTIDVSLGLPLLHASAIEVDPRWRLYGARVAELGIRAQTAIPLCPGGRLVGVLNLYSSQPGPIDEAVLEAALALATAAGDALLVSRHIGTLVHATHGRPDVNPARAPAPRAPRISKAELSAAS